MTPDAAKGAKRARLERIAFALGLLTLVVIGTWSMPDTPPPPPIDEVPREAAPAQADEPLAPLERRTFTATSPAEPLPPTGRLRISGAALVPGEPYVVHFALPEPSADAEPRPVRIISQPDHRVLEIEAPLAADRSSASVAIDPAYLQPGLYLVEVRTTERNHFPIRRYGILVEGER